MNQILKEGNNIKYCGFRILLLHRNPSNEVNSGALPPVEQHKACRNNDNFSQDQTTGKHEIFRVNMF